MAAITLEGVVEDGRIRLTGNAVLPDKTKVYVVVPDAPPSVSRIASPRLADPRKQSDFVMEMTEPFEAGRHGEL